MLRSPETDAFDLEDIIGQWQIWVGSIGKADVSISCNSCKDESDCNLNGQCTEEKTCNCTTEDGVSSSSFMIVYDKLVL